MKQAQIRADHDFCGIPKAGPDFLRALKKHNDREWFRARKNGFDEQLKLPMERLVSEIAAGCRKRGLMLYAKDKNPLTRIYRDVRFSSDKRPFNTHLGAGFRRSPTGDSFGEVYIHISFDKLFLAAGFWMPERPFLQLWRESILTNPAGMKKMVKILQKRGLNLSQEHRLTRLPRGFDAYAETGIADFLRLTSYVTSRELQPDECRSPELVEQAVDFALASKPLLEYGWGLDYQPKRDILED